MKLLAIIIAFYPDENEFYRNIVATLPFVDQLVIYQNTAISRRVLEAGNADKIVCLGNGENVGIATALNAGVEWAIKYGFTHLLTLDQDSYFKGDLLNRYKSFVDQNNMDNFGVFGINPSNWGKLLFDSNQHYIEVSDTITSGSIIPVSVFKDHGPFEDDLFIDAVDYEFCYRLKSKGIKTIVFPEIILEHKVGERKKTWLGFKTDNYSAFRTYYIIRNQIIIWRRYPEIFPGKYKIVLAGNHIFLRIVKILLAEDDKMRKIRSIITGLVHGIKGRTGFYKI